MPCIDKVTAETAVADCKPISCSPTPFGAARLPASLPSRACAVVTQCGRARAAGPCLGLGTCTMSWNRLFVVVLCSAALVLGADPSLHGQCSGSWRPAFQRACGVAVVMPRTPLQPLITLNVIDSKWPGCLPLLPRRQSRTLCPYWSKLVTPQNLSFSKS